MSLALILSVVAAADELRSDEGVSIPVPEGWTRRTARLGATTVLALERIDAGQSGIRPTIVVNSLETQAITEDNAFQQTRELVPKPGDVVERPSGRYLRVDFDYATEDSGGPRRIMSRLYAGLREKRLYFFVLRTNPDSFGRDTAAIDSVVDGAKFFSPKPKPAPPPPSPPRPVERTDRPADVRPANTPPPPPRPSPPAVLPPTRPPPTTPEEPLAKKEPSVRTSPGAVPRLEGPPRSGPARSDPAAVSSPTIARVRTAGKTNLLFAKTLIAHDGELDSDGRLAQNLVDPAATKGWCSSPSTAGRSKRFVFELPHNVDVARVTFDAACPEEAGFEGAGAREVAVQGSVTSSRGPWQELGRCGLEKGKNDQSLDLPANETRWIRVEVLSNYGHPTLTQLLKIRAFPSELVEGTAAPAQPKPKTTDEGPLRIERVRLTREKTGSPLDPAILAPSDEFWVHFKPRALRLDEKGEYGIEVDVRIQDAAGTESKRWLKVVDHHGKPPAPPLSSVVSIKVELPEKSAVGRYFVRLDVRDKETGAEITERIPFEVKETAEVKKPK